MKRIILLFSIIPVALLSMEAQNTNDLSDSEKIYGLSLIWKEASDHFAYFDRVPEINWDDTYQEYLGKVLETESLVEYYDVLKQYLALLQDGHTRIFPPQEYRDYCDEPKIKLCNIRNQAVVENVGISLTNSIPIGSYITKINDIPVDEYIIERKLPYICCTPDHFRWTVGILELLKEKKGTTLKIAYVTPKGKTKEMTLTCNSRDLEEEWTVNQHNNRESLEYRQLDNELSYIAMHTYTNWDMIEEFKAVIPEIQKSKGIILDVRNNGGGDSDISHAILKHFIDNPFIVQRWKTRDLRSAYKAWGKWTSQLPADALREISPERKNYLNHYLGNAWYVHTPDTIYPSADQRIDLPVAVLAGQMTASAAEDFLTGSKAIEGVVTIGERTAGFPGIPLFVELPGGGFALITTTRELNENGEDNLDIRHGIEPDIKIQPTIEDVVANRDPVLEKAIELLSAKVDNTVASLK